MKIRSLLTDSTEHSCSSYGEPVLVNLEAGEAIDCFSYACSEVVEATKAELKALQKAGYRNLRGKGGKRGKENQGH